MCGEGSADRTQAPDAAVLFPRRDDETPEAYDRRWYRERYQGESPQLTPRALLTGMLLGAVLAISNLYVGLKAGWALSVAITACVVSAAVWQGMARVGLSRSPISILEQNCMQSTASAAGYTTSAALVTAVPAYMLITGVRIAPIWLVLWTFFTSILGLALAIPFKRQLLHYERLAWPSAVAAAQTLKTLHGGGARVALQARWLAGAAAVSSFVRFAIDNTFSWWSLPRWPATLHFGGSLAGTPASALGIGVDASTLYLAAGAILGRRVSVWMLIGSATVWLGFAPWMLSTGRLEDAGYGSVMLGFALWAGASMMVTAGLTSLVTQLESLLRGLPRPGRWDRAGGETDVLAEVEIPLSWSIVAATAAAVGIVVVGAFAFGIAWYWSVVAILASAGMAGVAIRATGETDIIPAGSLGKLVQLGYGALAPRAVATNLLGTSVVTVSAATAADVSTNLKCGHLLGASPRQQFLAQALGVLVGTAIVVPAFAVLVPTADVLGQAHLPAPAAQAWRVVAEVVSGGVGGLAVEARWALGIGAVLGVILGLGDGRAGRWWPSALGLGMGMVIPFSESAAFFVGAMLAYAVQKLRPRDGTEAVIATSSGCIAGDSLMGVLLALLVSLGWMAA